MLPCKPLGRFCHMSANDLGISNVALLSVHSSPDAPLGGPDAGGMNLYVRRLALELSALNVSVDMFTRKSSYDQPDLVQLGTNVRLIHLDAGPPAAVPKRLLSRYIAEMSDGVVKFSERHGARYDVLHCHYWLSGLVGLRCRPALQCPVISMFHTLSKVKGSYLPGAEGAGSVARFSGEQQVLAGSDAVIGATPLEYEQFASLYGTTPARFEVIAPGVDADLFRPHPREASRKRLGIDAEKIIVFVGRLDPMKQLNRLFEAVALLPSRQLLGLRIIVVGGNDSDAAALNEYRLLARTLQIDGLIDFRSNVPQSELPLYLSAADVCAVPSAYESFGMVAVESMACETPVVAFGVGGLATTVKHERTGYLARPGSTADFSRQLGRALDNTDLGIMGRRGRLSVQQYNWPSVARATLEVYSNVANGLGCGGRQLVAAG